MRVGERADGVLEGGLWKVMAQLTMRPWGWSNRWRCTLIVCLEVLFPAVVLQHVLKLCKHHRPGEVALTLNATSSPTLVLWLQGTGMVEGMWAMPGRWLLLPVFGFKLDLQSEKQSLVSEVERDIRKTISFIYSTLLLCLCMKDFGSSPLLTAHKPEHASFLVHNCFWHQILRFISIACY